MLTDRALVRIGLQRSTIHLVTADDALWMRPLHDAVLRKPLSSFARNLDGVDRDAVAAAAQRILDDEPLTWAELGRRLATADPAWADRDPASLAQIARAHLALVQLPPRGVWGSSGQALHANAETWLGRPLDDGPRDEAAARLLLRYLAAFGPATVMDAQAWCGITRLTAVAHRLRDQDVLTTFSDEEGRELLDLPDAPRPDPDTPAPARLLYDYDNLLLSHADRSRFKSATPLNDAFTGIAPQRAPGAVLVDGVVRGAWVLDPGTLTIRTAGLTRPELEVVEAEGEALRAFLDAGLRLGLTRC